MIGALTYERTFAFKPCIRVCTPLFPTLLTALIQEVRNFFHWRLPWMFFVIFSLLVPKFFSWSQLRTVCWITQFWYISYIITLEPVYCLITIKSGQNNFGVECCLYRGSKRFCRHSLMYKFLFKFSWSTYRLV